MMSKTIGEKLALTALQEAPGYRPENPDQLNCAAFVSDMMKKVGLGEYWTAWVPDFFTIPGIFETSAPRIGDLVIFHSTYNAPGGSDKTHVGIVIDPPNQGSRGFVHFSASKNRAIVQSFTEWWIDHIECYLRLPEPNHKPEPKEGHLKLFYHGSVNVPRIVNADTGKKETVAEMLTTIRTENGRLYAIQSHRFQNKPMLTITDKGESRDYKVLSIGSDGLKYEVSND